MKFQLVRSARKHINAKFNFACIPFEPHCIWLFCRVWNVHTGEMLNTLIHHCEAVLHLRFQEGMMVTCSKVFTDRAVFTWVSKVIYVCFGFALLCSVIGLKISRHFLDQSELKPKPIVTQSRTFSHASRQLHVHVFASSFDWFTGLSMLFWLARVTTLVLVLRHSIENCSMLLSVDNINRKFKVAEYSFHVLFRFNAKCKSKRMRSKLWE